jgi:hypothetical protein
MAQSKLGSNSQTLFAFFYCLLNVVSLILLFAIIETGCDPEKTQNSHFSIENNLNANIICLPGYNYPDLNMNFTNRQAIILKLGQFEVEAMKTKVVDTLGLCEKEVWDKVIKHIMLMLFVLDKDKFIKGSKLEDALLERYYFSYDQLLKCNGVIAIR